MPAPRICALAVALALAGGAAPVFQEPSPEALAQALFDDAAKREKANAGKPDLIQAAYHDVCIRLPFTVAGRKAALRCVELDTDLRQAIDKEFEKPKLDAEAKVKEGRHADAVALIKAFAESTAKEPLKRRAAVLVATLENDARQVYNAAVKAAKTAATSGAFDEAAKKLTTASEHSIGDVRDAAESDLALLDRYRRVEEDKKAAAASEAAWKAFGGKAAALVKRVKDRAYADALKDLDAAIADPAFAACKDLLTVDRAAVAAAQSFWESLQKGLKSRLNQEVVFQTKEGKIIRGTLKRVGETGATLRLETPGADVALDALSSDQLLILGLGRDGLPETAGASYAAAAMWFFLEGRDPMARAALATASDLACDISALEASWRRGFFRSVMGVPK